jgi:methylmalonyl-CoA mutase N-terminal domain/subunit
LLRQQGLEGYPGFLPPFFVIADAATSVGFDPDHPAVKGQIAGCGVNYSTLKDYELLFDGLPLEKMNVVFSPPDVTIVVMGMYIVYAERRGIPQEKLRALTLNYWYMPMYCGGPHLPGRYSLKLSAECVKYAAKYMPYWLAISFDGYGFQAAGANTIQQLAFMLAPCIALTEKCIQMGLDPDSFLPRFGLHIAPDNEFFESVAKHRALRKLWARTNHERFGCKNPRSMMAVIQSETAATTLMAQQPLNNIIRATIQTLAAVLGGANSMWTTPYDEPFEIPTEESAILSVRTQQIIQHETGLTRVTDPLAGSYYVEWLTKKIEDETTKLLEWIESQGFVNLFESGWFRKELEKEAYKWRKGVESGEIPIVGVNKFVTKEDKTKVNTFERDPKAEQILIDRVKQYRKNRDQQKLRQALLNLRKVAHEVAKEDKEDLMPAVLDAVRAGATLQEQMDIIKAEFGGYGPTY